MLNFRFFLPVLLLSFFPIGSWGESTPKRLPEGFVYCEEVVPGIRSEIRYATAHNFVGEPIDGYRQPRCILTRSAALALGKAEAELRSFGLGLKVFDGYRPQRAVDHFVRWAKNGDTRMKAEFYPAVQKSNLFKEDYIAARSGHSRGSTLDLTVVSSGGAQAGMELDMGTGFDFFGPQSWPEDGSMTTQQRANRMLLQMIMKKSGFRPYAKEWWHFTLEQEPFPGTYFDFPVE